MERDYGYKRGFIRHLGFLKANFYILKKRIFEYKANVWSSIVLEVIYLIIMLFFYQLIINNFSDVIPWKMKDFILYFMSFLLIFTILGIFTWRMPLYHQIKEGLFNNYLTRPINPFVFFNSIEMPVPAVVMFFIDTIFFIIAIFYFDISISSPMIFLVFLLLIMFFYFFFISFIFSLDFIKLGLSETLFPFINSTQWTFENYPAPFFEGLKYKFLMQIFPIFIFGLIIIPIARDSIGMSFLLKELIVILVMILVSAILTLIIWNRGLKRYEAYG